MVHHEIELLQSHLDILAGDRRGTDKRRYATNGWIVSGTIANPNSSPVGLGQSPEGP